METQTWLNRHNNFIIYIYICLGVRVLANAQRDWGSIPSRVIPKT